VKEGHIDYPAPDPALSFNRVLSCHCMINFLRRDTKQAGSSDDWQHLRELWLGENFQHRAARTNGQS
jgi:hypothetical protein